MEYTRLKWMEFEGVAPGVKFVYYMNLLLNHLEYFLIIVIFSL
jgi:hypothetical protein